jgi:non-reducing end alpha-L-arabinofuranosidase
MDAVYFGTLCWFPTCNGSGPWVQADLENGLFGGGNGNNPNNAGNKSTFVTALVKNNGTSTYAIKGGNADSGGLTTWYSGSLPTAAISPCTRRAPSSSGSAATTATARPGTSSKA